MSVLDTVVRFTAAWLAVGLGLFIASGAIRTMRPLPASRAHRRNGLTTVLAVLPLVLGLALVWYGFVEFVRVVPW